MKGDLHTLKRICEYASKVMLGGEVVLGVVLAATVVLAACSLFSDGAADVLHDLIGLGKPCDLASVSALLEVVVILLMALFTVWTVYSLMISIMREHSPFNEPNTNAVILISKVYLACSVVLAVLSVLADGGLTETLFLFFGCVLIGVVLYCFALVIRYGAVLQDESDHTL